MVSLCVNDCFISALVTSVVVIIIMSNCAVAAPLAPHSVRTTTQQFSAAAEQQRTTPSHDDHNNTARPRSAAAVDAGKENMEVKAPQGWLSRVCSKLLGAGGGGGSRQRRRRQEKCEKCGRRSDTCLANPSFISGRKHFLCHDCRAASDNIKNMYHQLCRNFSLRGEAARTASGCGGGGRGNSAGGGPGGAELTPPPSGAASPGGAGAVSRRGVVRSRSMRSRKTAPESGYETATSLDSSCSVGTGNGRLSPVDCPPAAAASTSSCVGAGECGRCCSPAHADPHDLHHHHHHQQPCAAHADCARATCSKDTAVTAEACSRDRGEVFGGAFKSERTHLREIHPQKSTKQRPVVYTRPQQQQQQQQQQQPRPAAPAAGAGAQAPHHHRHHHQQGTEPYHYNHNQQQQDASDRYDGYLEIRIPNPKGVKYVFRQQQAAEQEALNDEVQANHLSRRRHTETLKQCYRCRKHRCIAFRAPFQSGWLCEDCMDDLL